MYFSYYRHRWRLRGFDGGNQRASYETAEPNSKTCLNTNMSVRFQQRAVVEYSTRKNVRLRKPAFPPENYYSRVPKGSAEHNLLLYSNRPEVDFLRSARPSAATIVLWVVSRPVVVMFLPISIRLQSCADYVLYVCPPEETRSRSATYTHLSMSIFYRSPGSHNRPVGNSFPVTSMNIS